MNQLPEEPAGNFEMPAERKQLDGFVPAYSAQDLGSSGFLVGCEV
ncbi:hypothetical protein OAF42_03365 [Planctomicrobium sp.]|nr:hypothetical protein [Planctomicrobium sp.]MDB4733462.1 hypothetical protein [Planctomicrobium sp.]